MPANHIHSTWPQAHSDALRVLHAASELSFAEIAQNINERFGTSYSRNAAIGRAARLGLTSPDKPKPLTKERKPRIRAPRQHIERERYSPESRRVVTIIESAETVKLRCVEIVPRHLTLDELGENECHYPFGGFPDPVTFCGHGPRYVATTSDRITGAPIEKRSSYCKAHHFLCLGNGTPTERAAHRGIAA